MTDELPDPPEGYTDGEREAFRAGQAAMAELLGGHALTLANHFRGADGDPEADDEPDTCDDCGADLVDAMGGAVCPNDACPPEEDTNA